MHHLHSSSSALLVLFCLSFLLRDNEPRAAKSMITRLFQLLLLNPERKLQQHNDNNYMLQFRETPNNYFFVGKEREERIHNSLFY